MTRLILIAALGLGVAGCGADGVPQAPAGATAPAGITITGDARIGIVSE